MPSAAGTRFGATMHTPDRGHIKNKQIAFVLSGVVIAGAVLRCLMLGKESLWFDELQTWFISIDLGRALRAEPTNPPVYHLVMYVWMHLFGVSEIAIRSFSILPSVAALFLTWRIGSALLPRRTALLAVAYQSFSTFHISYAQEARTHALLLFLLSTCFLIVLKVTTPGVRHRTWWLAGYALLAALSMYTHFVAAFYVAMHALYVLVVCWRDIRTVISYAAAAAAASLLFSPWLIRMLQTAGSGGQLRRHLFLKVPQTYLSFLFGDTLIPLDEVAVQHIRETLITYAPAAAAAVIAAGIVALFAVRALRRAPLRAWAAIVIMGVGPIAVSLAVSLAGVPMFDERYVLSSTPFVYLAAAVGFTEMWRSAGQALRGRLAAGVVTGTYLLLMVISLFNYYGNPRFGKEQWRETIADIEKRTPAGVTAVIVYEPDFIKVSQKYYGRRDLPAFLVTPDVKVDLLSSDKRITEAIGGADLVWLVRSHERDDQILDAFRRVLDERSHAVYPKSNGIDVFEFRRAGANTIASIGRQHDSRVP